MEGEETKRYIHHYYMPPFSLGEVGRLGWPSRREIGHGALAEKALEPVVPPEEKFPYTIRVVSEIMSSNGSTSMAAVCGSTLSLMDAGVPIKAPIAGIAMGKVGEVILSDITGLEDFHGDMDFKIAGTLDGITAVQMDMKIGGISQEILKEALKQAREGRLFILAEMKKILSSPRKDIAPHAPRFASLKIKPDKIGLLIGPGGKNIKKIQADTNATVEIEDDGTVLIYGSDEESVNKAMQLIEGCTASPEVGRIYNAKVVSIKDFGAFVEILPGTEGLVHISELADSYVRDISDVVKLGEMIQVKVIAIDDMGRPRLSRKALMNR
jgi:polyribonucleotide nucleotidyltransferase